MDVRGRNVESFLLRFLLLILTGPADYRACVVGLALVGPVWGCISWACQTRLTYAPSGWFGRRRFDHACLVVCRAHENGGRPRAEQWSPSGREGGGISSKEEGVVPSSRGRVSLDRTPVWSCLIHVRKGGKGGSFFLVFS